MSLPQSRCFPTIVLTEATPADIIVVLSQRFFAHGDTLVNLALENRGIFQVEVYDEGDGREGKKRALPPLSRQF